MRFLRSAVGNRACAVLSLLLMATTGILVSAHWSVGALAAQQVMVRPGNDIQALVAKYPPDTTFQITPGVYRLQSVRPKDRDAFVGEPGAVMTGAALLSSFDRQGQYWVTNVNVTSQASYRGKCDAEHPACTLPEDLFFDSVPLQRVTRLSDVGPGKWYLDYDDGKAYVGSDPSGHVVEMSSQRAAFWGNANGVTIKGLTVEKYASIAGRGAITPITVLSGPGPTGKGWAVVSNDLFLNHGAGVHATEGMVITNNKIHDNGQIGIVGGGSNVLIEGNEIYGNNYAGYTYHWEAGGATINYFSNHVTFRNNYVHDNKGPGLHADIADDDFVFEGNHTARNLVSGIHFELSYHGVIRNNTIEDDGFSPGGTSLLYGAGILITNSSDVEVYGNTVTDCMNGIGGSDTNRGNNARTGVRYALRNVYVHNNTITQKAGTAAGIVKSRAFDNSVFTSWNNRFEFNTFHLANVTGRYFEWMNTALTLAEWEKQHPNDQAKLGLPPGTLINSFPNENLLTSQISQLLYLAAE